MEKSHLFSLSLPSYEESENWMGQEGEVWPHIAAPDRRLWSRTENHSKNSHLIIQLPANLVVSERYVQTRELTCELPSTYIWILVCSGP